MKLKLTKGLLAAVLAAFTVAPAMAEVTYDTVTNYTAGEAMTLGATTASSETPILIQVSLAQLSAVTGPADLVLTKNANTSQNVIWGARAISGGAVTANWQGNNYGNTSASYASIAALDTESTGSVSLVATIGKNGVKLTTTDGTAVFENTACKSTTHDIVSYTIDGTGIVTAANKAVGGTSLNNLAGSGTLLLPSSCNISGGGNSDITLDLNGNSVTFTGDTTLNKIGSYSKGSNGLTVKAGVTLTAAIDSSWNPGNIAIEDGAAIEADHLVLSTNAVSNVTGQGSLHVENDLETFNGGKINTSVASFVVDGNITLGSKNAGANNGTLTISGGEFEVKGNTTVNSGRTLNVSGGTATFGGDVTVNGTANFTGGSTTINGIVTNNGTINVGDGVAVSFNIDASSTGSLNILGSLNTETDGDVTTSALTMKAGSVVTLGTNHENNTLTITQTLTVNGAATLNANLVIADEATLHMNDTLTMGCDVELGEGITLEGNLLASLLDGSAESITLFTGVDALTLGGVEYSHALYGYEVFSNPELVNTDDKKYVVSYNGSDVKLTVVPEPATATLSLLALAALASRRRRH